MHKMHYLEIVILKLRPEDFTGFGEAVILSANEFSFFFYSNSVP